MSKWDKLITRICNLSKDLRFDELRKVLESYGYEMNVPRSGSSHYTFRIISGNPRQFNYRDESANCAYLHL